MKRQLTVPVLFLLLINASGTARADSDNPLDADPDQWRFTIDFTIEFKDILENLSFGLKGELYANRGPFGNVDVYSLNLGPELYTRRLKTSASVYF